VSENLNTGFDTVCYKRNFLKNVIARVDFPSPVEGLKDQVPSRISKKILKTFPIAEPKKVIARELMLSPNSLKQKELEMTEWHFHGKDRTKTLTIIPSAIFVEYRAYRDYETLREEFLNAVGLIFENYKDVVGSRLGLRYINEIALDEANPLSWNDYLNEKMLYLLHFYPDPQVLSRVFSNVEMNFGEFNVRYQFGIHNPDFPATIRKKQFIVDIDAYSQGVQEYGEISVNLKTFHDRIQELFEMSITDSLRRIMNDGE